MAMIILAVAQASVVLLLTSFLQRTKSEVSESSSLPNSLSMSRLSTCWGLRMR